MQITFKLYASLTHYLPPDQRIGNRMELDVAEGESVMAAAHAAGYIWPTECEASASLPAATSMPRRLALAFIRPPLSLRESPLMRAGFPLAPTL